MKILYVLVVGFCLLGGVACSDDSAPSGGGGGASQAGASASSAGASQTGTAGVTGGSDYCSTYCQCHQTNCASTAIPGGGSCLDFCAAWPDDAKLRECRLGMCSIAPAQPDNDHCTHSVGIGECLAP